MPAVKSQEDQLREIMMAAQPASGYQNTAKMLAGRRQPVRHWAEALGNFATGLSSHMNTQAAAQAEQQQALAKQRLAQMNRRDPIADYKAKMMAEQEVRAQQMQGMDQLSPYQQQVFAATGNIPAPRKPTEPKRYEVDGRLVDAQGNVVYQPPQSDVDSQIGPHEDLKDALAYETSVRKEFSSQVKPFREVLQGYNTIESLEPEAIKGNPAAQVSLMFAFMKMVDPGSRVTAGEIATFEDTAGVPARVRNAYNSIVEGTPLPAKTVTQYINEARGLANTAASSFSDVRKDYLDIAKGRVDPEKALPRRRMLRFQKAKSLRAEAEQLIQKYGNDPSKVERIRKALIEKLKAL